MTRPESQAAAADRLSAELGLKIHRSAVRHLLAKGIDVKNPQAVRHALRQQERMPRRIGPDQTKTKPTPKTGPIISDKTIRDRTAEISVGMALWEFRDFADHLLTVAPSYLAGCSESEAHDYLRALVKSETAHLLEVWP